MTECLRTSVKALDVSASNDKEGLCASVCFRPFYLVRYIRAEREEASFWRLFFGSFLWPTKEMNKNELYLLIDKVVKKMICNTFCFLLYSIQNVILALGVPRMKTGV